MRKISLFIITAATAALFAACGAPADNKPANTNTNANTAKPVAAAPTADALLALDKAANEAWLKGDAKYFDGFLSDKFVSFEGGTRMGKADLAKMIGENKCDVKEGWKLEEPQVAMIDADTYVMTYKSNFDGTCVGKDGKSIKIPSPTRGASVYVRNGDKWQGVFHAENLIIGPKAAPAADTKDEAKKEEPKKADVKKEEPKKEEAKKEEPKKDASKKDDARKDDVADSTATAIPAKPVADPNTEALVKLHTAGWEAFKAKDAKKFEELLTANMTNVDPIGGVVTGKANVIKHWTETMKCEGITKVSVADGFASALSPTVELITLKGSADGTCDGQRNGPLYQAAFYVKEGDAWKLAFMFESLGR